MKPEAGRELPGDREGDPPRCAACGQVIGVYEPYMLVTDDRLKTGSRAADPLVSADGVLYHLACYPPT